MKSINQYQTYIIATAVVFGLILGRIETLSQYAAHFIVPFLIIMLFGLFLNIPLKDLFSRFSNLKFFTANLSINFIWTPLIAFGLGYLLLGNYPELWIGFVMLMVTPCTDWYLIFTSIAKGNLPLSASVLPLNLILQIILLPVFLLLFFGESGSVDSGILLKSILIVLLVPFGLAQSLKALSSVINRKDFVDVKLSPFFEKTQVIFLGLAILAMFASQGEVLTQNLHVVFILIIPILIFFVVNFFVGRMVSSIFIFNYADSASLNLTTLARNSPVALAIAVTAFPNQPLIALALVIGPLIELPLLAIVSQILLKIRKSNTDNGV